MTPGAPVTSARRSERKNRDPNLGILAARTLFAFQAQLFARLAEQGHERVSPRHGAVLAYLDGEGIRATKLARLSGRHKQIIGRLVDELEELVGELGDLEPDLVLVEGG